MNGEASREPETYTHPDHVLVHNLAVNIILRHER